MQIGISSYIVLRVRYRYPGTVQYAYRYWLGVAGRSLEEVPDLSQRARRRYAARRRGSRDGGCHRRRSP
eukprot:COSAG04_NODE_19841_length_407_cov_0.600649_1_plen_68_part_10